MRPDDLLPGVPPGSPRRFRSFSRRFILRRALFSIVWIALARWTPSPLHRWRRLVLVAFGADIHPTARVFPHVSIFSPGLLRMGPGAVIGRHTYCFNFGAAIVLDAYADVAWGVTLATGSHAIDDKAFQATGRPITIGSHAWVAAESMVGPGVRLGEGAVLGARAVTFRDLDPWTVYLGNPAAPVRLRRRFAGTDALAA